jgi:uncharacterized Ntn-hydrolase superfamily protein
MLADGEVVADDRIDDADGAVDDIERRMEALVDRFVRDE